MSSFIILSLFIVPALAQDCSSLVPLEDYDLPLHIASVFILVFVSLVGSLSPVLFNAKVPKMVSRIGLLFGAGTILATGFIHSTCY